MTDLTDTYREIQAMESHSKKVLAKVNEVMGNAEIEGEDQTFLCQLLVEDKPMEVLMMMISMVDDEAGWAERKEREFAGGLAKAFVAAMRETLTDYYKDQEL